MTRVYSNLPKPRMSPFLNASTPSWYLCADCSYEIFQSVSVVPVTRLTLSNMSLWLIRKLEIYTTPFPNCDTVEFLSFSSTGSSGRLNSAATARPHCSHVLVLILVLPSSKNVTLLSLKSNPYRMLPPARLNSYQKLHASITHLLTLKDSISSTIDLAVSPSRIAFLNSSFVKS